MKEALLISRLPSTDFLSHIKATLNNESQQDSLFDANTSLKSLNSAARRRGSTESNTAEGGDDDSFMEEDSDSGATITSKKQVYPSKRGKNKDLTVNIPN